MSERNPSRPWASTALDWFALKMVLGAILTVAMAAAVVLWD
jgi:hypothetical protein